jgi:Fe-S-cluster containining protein
MSEEQSLLPDLEQPLAPSYALSEHSLTYIPELRVGEEVFTYRYASSCSMMSCSAKCCRYGVLVDIAHRDRILSEAALVVQYMEPTQEHDPSRWFDSEVEIDEDFPSGRVVNTNTHNDSCVFLDSSRRCVLHMAESASPGLKPFYCRAYPIAIVRGRITIDADWCPEETNCCGPVEGGELTALDVCGGELTFMLGEAGFREVQRVANDPNRLVT